MELKVLPPLPIDHEQLALHSIVQKFEDIFERESVRDAGLFKEPIGSPYAQFRTLKETLRSRDLNETDIDEDDLRALSVYLVHSPKYSEYFKDWLRTRKTDWDMKTLPVNTHHIYKLGVEEFLKI
ncbi:MAG TPA: hypothetical protein VFI61_04055 [Patescibacteria group bacterium]|nr:hypothetical protein [Patescibacteria group bacterium]